MNLRREIDITENIASGNIDHILTILHRFRETGFDRLYWDGYESSISLYKSHENSSPKVDKKEETNKPIIT